MAVMALVFVVALGTSPCLVKGESAVRFANLLGALEGGGYGYSLALDGLSFFQNVTYPVVTDYETFSAGNYTVEVTLEGSQPTDPPLFKFEFQFVDLVPYTLSLWIDPEGGYFRFTMSEDFATFPLPVIALRFAHFSQSVGPVNVVATFDEGEYKSLLWSDVRYSNFTAYATDRIEYGTVTFTFLDATNNATLFSTATDDLPADHPYTCILLGNSNDANDPIRTLLVQDW